MADYNESQQLQLEDDFCKIFNVVGKQQANNININELETLNMRNVKYLQISLKSLNLNSKQFQDKSIKLNVKLPMIRNNIIEYQIHQTYDIGKNGKSLMFNAQFRSNFQLTENSLGQINQAIIYFQVFSLDVEIGKAEFVLSTMIIDRLRCFTYQVPIQQLAQVQNKNNKKGKVDKLIETGQLEFEIQLQDIDARSQQVEQSPKKEIDIEEQVQKIYEKVTEQNQKDKERKRLLKLQQEEEINQQLISQLESFQLYLNIGKMIHLNQIVCQEKIDDEQINLYFEIEILWNLRNKLNPNQLEYIQMVYQLYCGMSCYYNIFEQNGKYKYQIQQIIQDNLKYRVKYQRSMLQFFNYHRLLKRIYKFGFVTINNKWMNIQIIENSNKN